MPKDAPATRSPNHTAKKRTKRTPAGTPKNPLHVTETLPNQKPCGYCTRVLRKSSNCRAANAATRTKRFCVDCDMYLCGPCSKKCKEHAQARLSHQKLSVQSAKKRKRGSASNAKKKRKRGSASNAKQPRSKRALPWIKKNPSLFQTV